MGHKCELCGQPVRVVGDTTLHYEPAPEQLTRPGDGDLIKSLKTTILEQSDQIESLSAECERLKKAHEWAKHASSSLLMLVEQQALKIEHLTWRSVPMTVVHEDESITYDGPPYDGCRHCGAPRPHHLRNCPAGEE